MDGYGSHMAFEFYTFAKDHKIELFRLPPHSTHLTQPLDVGCFQPFKHHPAEALDEIVRNSGVDFDKLDFYPYFNACTLQRSPNLLYSLHSKTRSVQNSSSLSINRS